MGHEHSGSGLGAVKFLPDEFAQIVSAAFQWTMHSGSRASVS